MWTVEFSSAKFLPYLPEDCQQNPGAYGFELALWLSQELARRQIYTSYPIGEDWGWFIERSDGEAEFMIGCSSVAAESTGYDGKPILWRVFISQPRSLLQRLKGRTAASEIEQLSKAVEAVLRAEELSLVLTEA
jgi:hypothetical protein